MSKSPIYVGYEASMGYVKSYSNVTEGLDTYRNTLTEITKDVYETNVKSNSTNFDDHTNQVYKVEMNSKEPMYFRIGKDKNDKATDGFDYNSKSKYAEDLWLAANFIAIYRQVMSENIKASRDLYVSTGLPTIHSVDQKLRDSIKESLKQTVTINDDTMQVSDVAIVPQGDASFFNDLFNFDGEINKEFIAQTSSTGNSQSTLLYFDIGFGTTDIKTIKDYSVSSDEEHQEDGVGKVFKKVLRELKSVEPDLYGVELLAVEEQLREGGKIDYNDITADLTDARNKILSEFAKTLIDRVDKDPFGDMIINQIRFVGGGAIIMQPYIDTYLQSKFKDNPRKAARYKFLEDIEESPFTNCLGFFKICVKKFQ